MIIAGLEKLTLLDYPGKLAAIVFTYGCDMRCPYCHNPELVVDELNRDLVYSEEQVLDFLGRRIGKLDALVITGGEPSMHRDLEDFIKRVKEMGFLVKLDTNGGSPDRVRSIAGSNIVDYWAMDLKFGPKLYAQGLGGGRKISGDAVRESAQLIMESGADYEFRTTFVRGLHDKETVQEIGEMLKGSKIYYIQNFRAGKSIDPSYTSEKSFTRTELEEFKDIMENYVEKVVIR